MKTKQKSSMMLAILVFLLGLVGSTKAGWVTSGNNMYADVPGNVGLGTTSPTFKLDVAGSARLSLPSSGTYTDFRINDSVGSLAFFVQNDGNVGIGTMGPVAKLDVFSSTDYCVRGHTYSTGDVENYGGHFTSAGERGIGVYGWAENTGDVQNYGGFFMAEGNDGIGIYAKGGRRGKAAFFEGAIKVIPIEGLSPTIFEDPNFHDGPHFHMVSQIYGESISSQRGIGVRGVSDKGIGVSGHSNSSTAVYGGSETGVGVWGHSYHDDAVVGVSEYGRAGYFQGNVRVSGQLTKGSGSFMIDHPLDPENKYLQHSFVESPDMMNVYNGNETLDENGQAVVQLPEYFKALNRDYRYQLTCIGGFAPVYIAEKISENRFKIAGGKSGMEVSWQVTGVRQDAHAVANRVQVEEGKPAEERGYYLHPKAYGLPEEKGIETLRNRRHSQTQEVAKNN